MEGMVGMARALGDETRYRILSLVETRALCVCELAAVLDMPQSTVSSHLRLLHRAQWLEAERCEKWMYYRLAPARCGLWRALHVHCGVHEREDSCRNEDRKRADVCVLERDCRCGAGPQRLATTGAATTRKKEKK